MITMAFYGKWFQAAGYAWNWQEINLWSTVHFVQEIKETTDKYKSMF